MDFIKIKLRRMRRRNRIPGRLFAAVSTALLLLVLSASLLALPAAAKNGMGMPRTEDGTVTDSDGIISDTVTGESPDTGDSTGGGAQSTAPEASTEGTVGGSDMTSAPGTSGSTGNGSAGDAESNTLGWIVGLVVLAGVVIAIVLIIRWASGSKKEH